MHLPGWWPRTRRRRRLDLLDVDAKLEQAVRDRRAAEKARTDARADAEWARAATAANRLDLRLDAAFRLQARKQGG